MPPDTKAAHVAEQRRLLHVAMTRARKRLVLAYPEQSPTAARAQQPSPFAEEARAAVGGEWEPTSEEELFGPAETLQSTFRVLRDELMTTVAEVGGRLGELRFDTDLDVSHAVVRYLEVMKLSALLERTRAGQSVAEALPEVNARLLQAVTAEQREIFETSALDEYLLDAERDERTRASRRRAARRAVAGAVPAPPRRRACCCQRLRHRDLPDVPAEVQVRARVPHPAGADAQPALRHPRPPGARALPRRRDAGRDAARAARAARRRAGGAAASATPSRRSSCRARPSRR